MPIHTNKGYLTEKVEVTPRMFSEVFCLPHSQSLKLKKISDAVMKTEFGPPEGTRGYYMVRNSPKDRAVHFTWYLAKVCLLTKTSLHVKDAFMPLYHAERGLKVDWASWIYDRCQLGENRDKRRSPSMERLAPFLHALLCTRSTWVQWTFLLSLSLSL